MALRAVHPAESVSLADLYGVFESEVMGISEHGKLHAPARELIATQPPEPDPMKPSAMRIGCVDDLSQ